MLQGERKKEKGENCIKNGFKCLKIRDEDPDAVGSVDFGPPDPDPLIFGPPDPDPDPTCDNGFMKLFSF